MDWIQIDDGLGSPINVEGIYQQFTELVSANAKARFMRDYRLLPYIKATPLEHVYRKATLSDGGGESVSLCDDSRELDVMREVMDTCARLAAIAFGMGDGRRKATLNDLELVPGFEKAAGGAFLHIDLQGSYWYKRFLYKAIDCDCALGDRVFSPIYDRDLVDQRNPRDNGATGRRDARMKQLEIDSGTFKYSPELNASMLETIGKHYQKSALNDIAWRLGFRSFTPVPDPRFNDPDIPCEYRRDAEFWTDDELIIRGEGVDLRDAAGEIADTLLQMHTNSIRHYFSFCEGFGMYAPMGVCALWADFAQDVAKCPICICKTCGRPVVTHVVRGMPRIYCSDACRMRDKRREQKRAKDQGETE